MIVGCSSRPTTVVLVSLGFLLLLTTQCTIINSSAALPTRKQADELFEQTFAQARRGNVRTRGRHLPQIEVYVDGSKSMAGFIRGKAKEGPDYVIGQTTYAASLKDLKAMLSARRDRPLFHKFGGDSAGQGELLAEPTEAINRESFYDRGETPLGPLIRKFCNRSDEQLPAAFIVVTDGVQSTPKDSDFSEVVGAVSNLIKEGMHFEVLAFRSEFNGNAYSELRRESHQKESIGWFSGERGFYWYVFSLEPGFGQEVSAALHAGHQIDHKYLDLSAVPFGDSQVHLDLERGATRSTLQIRTKTADSDLILLRWPHPVGDRRSGKVKADIRLALNEEFRDFPMQSDFRLQVDSVNWSTREKTDGGISITNSRVVAESPEWRTLEFQLTCTEVGHSGWTGSRVSVFPKGNTFTPPQWVNDFSTDDDTSLSDYGKTLFLKSFIASTLLNGKLSDQPVAVFYVFIEGGR